MDRGSNLYFDQIEFDYNKGWIRETIITRKVMTIQIVDSSNDSYI